MLSFIQSFLCPTGRIHAASCHRCPCLWSHVCFGDTLYITCLLSLSRSCCRICRCHGRRAGFVFPPRCSGAVCTESAQREGWRQATPVREICLQPVWGRTSSWDASTRVILRRGSLKGNAAPSVCESTGASDTFPKMTQASIRSIIHHIIVKLVHNVDNNK